VRFGGSFRGTGNFDGEARMSVDELEKEALKLSPDERERLALSLLSSIHGELEYEVEWAEEVDRRAREIKEGRVELIPGDQVFREALDRLK
jgi:putative addiction module component (TIGR02574 family)